MYFITELLYVMARHYNRQLREAGTTTSEPCMFQLRILTAIKDKGDLVDLCDELKKRLNPVTMDKIVRCLLDRFILVHKKMRHIKSGEFIKNKHMYSSLAKQCYQNDTLEIFLMLHLKPCQLDVASGLFLMDQSNSLILEFNNYCKNLYKSKLYNYHDLLHVITFVDSIYREANSKYLFDDDLFDDDLFGDGKLETMLYSLIDESNKTVNEYIARMRTTSIEQQQLETTKEEPVTTVPPSDYSTSSDSSDSESFSDSSVPARVRNAQVFRTRVLRTPPRRPYTLQRQ
jgi:hypothetical protein